MQCCLGLNHGCASRQGLEAHARLRVILVADTAVRDMAELEYVAYLPMLEELDLRGTPVAMPSKSPSQSSCFRVKAINRLLVRRNPKNGL
jgi:hypothetical protein